MDSPKVQLAAAFSTERYGEFPPEGQGLAVGQKILFVHLWVVVLDGERLGVKHDNLLILENKV